MPRRLSVLAVIVVLTVLVGSDVEADGPSDAGVIFLKLPPGARAVGMGEAFVAQADDVTATWWNPAGLAFLSRWETCWERHQLLPLFHLDDLYYQFISAVGYVPSLGGTLGANFIYTSYGTTEGRDENNMPTGSFYSYDEAFTLAYGAKLNSKMGLGIAGKYVYSHLSNQQEGTEPSFGFSGFPDAFAADLGFLYREEFNSDNLMVSPALAMTLTNMGTTIYYPLTTYADPLPMTIRIGFSGNLGIAATDQVHYGFRINSDFDKELVDRYDDGTPRPFYEALFSSWSNNSSQNEWDGVTRHIGGELWGSSQSGDLLLKGAFRAGYFYDVLGDRKPTSFGFSAGFEYDLKSVLLNGNFDYAWLVERTNHPLQGTNMFTANLGLTPTFWITPLSPSPPEPNRCPENSSNESPRISKSLFSLTTGLAVLTGAENEYLNLGINYGLNTFLAANQNIYIGMRLAYVSWGFDAEEFMSNNFPGINYASSGSTKVIEIAPTVRLLTSLRDQSPVYVFGQAGFGLFIANSSIDLNSSAVSVSSVGGADEKPGFSFGGGVMFNTRYHFGVEITPLYHLIFTEGESTKYFTLNVGIGSYH